MQRVQTEPRGSELIDGLSLTRKPERVTPYWMDHLKDYTLSCALASVETPNEKFQRCWVLTPTWGHFGAFNVY